MIDAAAVGSALERVRDRIAGAGGDPERIRVLAVTKGFGADAIDAALLAGLRDVGENYAAELADKWHATEGGGATWHFVGVIQRNKVARLAPLVDCWQSVGRPEEGAAIARRRPGADVLVQVALLDSPARNGVAPERVPDLVGALGDLGLAVRGLMTVAPPEPAAASAAFATVRRLADDLGLPERSMGMSEDLEAAVAHGSTMVRIGRALFGPRPIAPPGD